MRVLYVQQDGPSKGKSHGMPSNSKLNYVQRYSFYSVYNRYLFSESRGRVHLEQSYKKNVYKSSELKFGKF